jgi:hypothetical protein
MRRFVLKMCVGTVAVLLFYGLPFWLGWDSTAIQAFVGRGAFVIGTLALSDWLVDRR